MVGGCARRVAREGIHKMVALRVSVSRAQEFQVLWGLHRRDIQGIVEVRGEEGGTLVG